MKLLRDRNIRLLLLLCLVIAGLLLSSRPQRVDLPTEDAYVLCRLSFSGQFMLLPLPKEGERTCPITQALPDGAEAENILHLTAEGFYMESANCKNGDCLRQGMVTLKNREDRLLQNCVICLPHQLTAELYTAGEIAALELPKDKELTWTERK